MPNYTFILLETIETIQERYITIDAESKQEALEQIVSYSSLFGSENIQYVGDTIDIIIDSENTEVIETSAVLSETGEELLTF